MNVSFTYKNFECSDHLRQYAQRRMEKLGRFFGKSAGLDVDVVLTLDRFRSRCEVAVSGEGLHLAASETAGDMYSVVDMVHDKLEAQIKRHVSRVKQQRRQARDAVIDVFTYNLDPEDPEQGNIRPTERFSPKPMHVEEAVMQLEGVTTDFFVFLNADNGRINVIYRAGDGEYGLIDPVV